MPTKKLIITPSINEWQIIRTVLTAGCEIFLCGIGPEAVAALRRNINTKPLPEQIILLGWGGGLDPRLNSGEAVLATAAISTDGKNIPCSPLLLPGTHLGPVLSVAEPLYTPQQKALAWQEYSALAVEMEALPIAAWAQAQHIPFYHARVILDSAQACLPDLAGTMDGFGNLHLRQMVSLLSKKPALLWGLLRLAKQVRRQKQNLSELGKNVIAALS